MIGKMMKMGIRRDRNKTGRKHTLDAMLRLDNRTNKHLLTLAKRIDVLSRRVRKLEQRLDELIHP